MYLTLGVQGTNDRTLMVPGRWKYSAMLSRDAHLSPPHRWKSVEGSDSDWNRDREIGRNEETQKLLNDVVSRLGLEPRTLALKGR